jgi:hypothetical protein
MSRFIGNRGTVDNLNGGSNFSMTGNLIVPVTNTLNTELIACSTAVTALGGSSSNTQCVTAVYQAGRYQTAAGGANDLFCTFTVPPGVQRVTWQMWGAGGGGGRGCGPAGRGVGVPGGGGGFMQFTSVTVPGETYCIRVGAGGTGVTYGGQGCRGSCTCICRVGGGLTVAALGGGGGAACRDCNATLGNSTSYPIGCLSIADSTCIVSTSCVRCQCGDMAQASGPYCACGYCCRSTAQMGGSAFMGGTGAHGNCKGHYVCSDAGGKHAPTWGGGGGGGSGHGSGQGLYSTPCCRGGNGAPGMVLIWM